MVPRSYYVCAAFLDAVKDRYRQRYNRQADLARDAQISTTSDTVSKFLNGRPVSRENFWNLCEHLELDWREVAGLTSPPEANNPNSADYSDLIPVTWVGREDLIRDLTARLEDSTKVLAIVGISGQGKTALAAKLAMEPRTNAWRRLSVMTFDSVARQEFVEAAETWLAELGDVTAEAERKQPQKLLRRLLRRLEEERCWLQIDSLELALEVSEAREVTQFRESAQLWRDFLTSAIESNRFRSRIVITSQDFPTELRSCKAKTWHQQTLGGLAEEQVQQLFEKLFQRPFAEMEVQRLLQMGNVFEGHPLAVETIAREILAPERFDGDLSWYWQEHCGEFEALERSSAALEEKVRSRVSKAFDRLKRDCPIAHDLLVRASVLRRAVSERFWLGLMADAEPDAVKWALRLLQERGLASSEVVQRLRLRRVWQHNLVRQVAQRRLAERPEDARAAHRRAAHLWRRDYAPEPEAANLERVRGDLEALHHACCAEDVNLARDIIAASEAAKRGNSLLRQLQIWGYYGEVVQSAQAYRDLCQQHGDLAGEGFACKHLGTVSNLQGQYPEAKAFHQQALDIARRLGKRRWEGIALGNLGNTCENLGLYLEAKTFHRDALEIFREIDDRRGEGTALGNLGFAYQNLGRYREAMSYLERHVKIAREIGDRCGEGTALGNLGVVYNLRGQYREAERLLRQQLDIARELGNRRGEGTALGNLGVVYKNLGKYAQAIELYEQHLHIAREIGDRRGESYALGNLGDALNLLGKYEAAIALHEEDLAIARDIGDCRGEGHALGNLGIVYKNLGKTGSSGNTVIR